MIEAEGSRAFEASALAASKTFRYAPRFVDGEAVKTTKVRTTFTFELARTHYKTESLLSLVSGLRYAE